MTPPAGCPLCEAPGGVVVARSARWRLVRAEEPGFPAFYRLVWQEHVREFTDLAPAQRGECMEAVAAVESVLRRHLQPAKVNVASLGNLVAHLHWHVVARFEWDSHWPGPVWAAAQRPSDAQQLARVLERRGALEAELAVLGECPTA